ncbi:MAG: hypothetical protein MHM6MM_006854 [Cercozoa sp. M6MM]
MTRRRLRDFLSRSPRKQEECDIDDGATTENHENSTSAGKASPLKRLKQRFSRSRSTSHDETQTPQNSRDDSAVQAMIDDENIEHAIRERTFAVVADVDDFTSPEKSLEKAPIDPGSSKETLAPPNITSESEVVEEGITENKAAAESEVAVEGEPEPTKRTDDAPTRQQQLIRTALLVGVASAAICGCYFIVTRKQKKSRTAA